MTELTEIRKSLASISESTARTAEAVKWIKEGMADHAKRLEGHMREDTRRFEFQAQRFDAGEKRIGKVEKGLSYRSGFWAALAYGLAFVTEHLFRPS